MIREAYRHGLGCLGRRAWRRAAAGRADRSRCAPPRRIRREHARRSRTARAPRRSAQRARREAVGRMRGERSQQKTAAQAAGVEILTGGLDAPTRAEKPRRGATARSHCRTRGPCPHLRRRVVVLLASLLLAACGDAHRHSAATTTVSLPATARHPDVTARDRRNAGRRSRGQHLQRRRRRRSQSGRAQRSGARLRAEQHQRHRRRDQPAHLQDRAPVPDRRAAAACHARPTTSRPCTSTTTSATP